MLAVVVFQFRERDEQFNTTVDQLVDIGRGVYCDNNEVLTDLGRIDLVISLNWERLRCCYEDSMCKSHTRLTTRTTTSSFNETGQYGNGNSTPFNLKSQTRARSTLTHFKIGTLKTHISCVSMRNKNHWLRSTRILIKYRGQWNEKWEGVQGLAAMICLDRSKVVWIVLSFVLCRKDTI